MDADLVSNVGSLLDRGRLTLVEAALFKAVVLAETDIMAATGLINQQLRGFAVGEKQIIDPSLLQPDLWQRAIAVTKGIKPA